MNNRLLMMQEFVTPEDIINFKCNKCMACCKKNDDLLLTGYDVAKLKYALQIDTDTFIKKYCEINFGGGSMVPTLRLNTQEVCPFLQDNKCSVYEYRPIQCMLFPLDRIIINDKTHYFYEKDFFKNRPCDIDAEEVKVGDLLKCLETDREEWEAAWIKLLRAANEIMELLNKNNGVMYILDFFDMSLEMLYERYVYNIEISLLEQVNKAIKDMGILKKHYKIKLGIK